MTLSIHPVRSDAEFGLFLRFPWTIYRGDRFWVAPLLDSRRERLDPERNPFWKTAERELWLVKRGQEVAGTLAAFWPRDGQAGGVGYFGFFEVHDDQEAARLLLEAGSDWLRARGAGCARGPYNPSQNDEPGILVEGFDSRPAITQGHNPGYYARLLEACGFHYHNDLVARLARLPDGIRRAEEILPLRLAAVAERAAKRADLRVRRLEPKHWRDEIALACDLYNRSMVHVADAVPIPLEEFLALAEGFRPILDPRLALIAEVAGRPVGFVLALPDINEALQPLNGRLDAFRLLRLWWGSKRLRRLCFKILVILPEYQGRGVEAVLISELGQGILERRFQEVDMSLTGDDNPQSSLFQEHLGFRVYRRYRVYQKDLKR